MQLLASACPAIKVSLHAGDTACQVFAMELALDGYMWCLNISCSCLHAADYFFLAAQTVAETAFILKGVSALHGSMLQRYKVQVKCRRI